MRGKPTPRHGPIRGDAEARTRESCHFSLRVDVLSSGENGRSRSARPQWSRSFIRNGDATRGAIDAMEERAATFSWDVPARQPSHAEPLWRVVSTPSGRSHDMPLSQLIRPIYT